ncbi:hypothetical protein KIN20_002584 [Parelaphostrongylus tenuis]|uniref:Nuclear pore complex protein Nup85 n=1 Tax=Parelaphostrongylus tenuis TaxID=148309 RepID=A0AAD5MEE9_PARTN|nr:hypothetical protein KIN20_002584 [Parelaphostrongylus tenuis]
MKEKLMTSEDALYYAYSSSDANIICGLSSVTAKGNDTAPPSGCFHGFREHSPSLQQVYANPVVRQLLIEMHIVFEKCQQLSRHEPLSNEETISISREYRSALLHCANEIEEDENMYIRDFTIWSLFETMFFQRGNTPICLDLISWGIDSFIFIDKVVQKASKELDEGISVGDGSYWRAVCLVLIGCRFDICIDFLALLKDDKAAGRFRSLLSSFEWSWLMDVGEMSKLDRWKHELSCLLTSGALNSNKNVLFLAQLLNGDPKDQWPPWCTGSTVTGIGGTRYLERAASAVVSEWWHLMPFYVFVKNFSVAYNELGALAKECRDLFKTVNDFKDEEFDPFLSILTMEDINVLQNVISNPWLSVHLIDTLLHTDKYDNLPTLQEARDFLLMEYGSGLIQNSSLWEIGANYLVYCGSEVD